MTITITPVLVLLEIAIATLIGAVNNIMGQSPTRSFTAVFILVDHTRDLPRNILTRFWL